MGSERRMPQEELVVKSPEMMHIYAKAKVLSKLKISVLILGESGVGKSRLAECICGSGPFIRVDCNAIPSDLFASELFGYTPNAFTGAASKGKVGLLEAANHGTILFDEINELSPDNQVLLLHFLQNKTITPIGALESKEIDARVISTAGRDLRGMIAEGSFRKDLYYRICVSEIHIPPLRERREEIPEFIAYFMERTVRQYGAELDMVSIPPETMTRLTELDWMGNIREIENFVYQLCFMGNTPEGMKACVEQAANAIKQADMIDTQAGTPQRKPLKEAVREFEKAYIQTAIDETPDLRTAARELGIGFSTLSRKKAELGITRRRGELLPPVERQGDGFM